MSVEVVGNDRGGTSELAIAGHCEPTEGRPAHPGPIIK